MQIISTPGKIDLSIRHSDPSPSAPRSPGLHVSSIIRNIAVLNGTLKQDAVVFGRNMFDPIDETDLPLAIALGCAWENYLAPQYPHWERPEEIESDGIYMSPDGIYYGTHPLSADPQYVLVEIKLTWKSTRHPIQLNQMYMQQCMSYCRCLGTRYCQLHVLYVNGNYQFGDSEGGGPQYMIYSICFTPEELESNWSLILYNAKLL